MENKSISSRSFESYDNKKYDTHSYRIEFIKKLLNGNIKSTIDFDSSNDNLDLNASDIREVLGRRHLQFYLVMKKLGATMTYITSGGSGHTFMGTIKENGMVFNFGIKVVAYPRHKTKTSKGEYIDDDVYGHVQDIKHPTNAELKMIKILSQFVLNKETPHIILPISLFATNITPFKDFMENDFKTVNNKEQVYKYYQYLKKKKRIMATGKDINLQPVPKIEISPEAEKYCKYREFIEKHVDPGNRYYYPNISILFSEWANSGDFLNYIRRNIGTMTNKDWRIFFFQILSVLAIIQEKYPGFRHNDLKANNILIHKRKKRNTKFVLTVIKDKYIVPDNGYILKLWDFDFACIPGIVDNNKVNAEWTTKINITSDMNRYYDVHYFFNTLPRFINNFESRVPEETLKFMNRIVPSVLRQEMTDKGGYCRKNRILINQEFTTPKEIIKRDEYFEPFRSN